MIKVPRKGGDRWKGEYRPTSTRQHRCTPPTHLRTRSRRRPSTWLRSSRPRRLCCRPSFLARRGSPPRRPTGRPARRRPGRRSRPLRCTRCSRPGRRGTGRRPGSRRGTARPRRAPRCARTRARSRPGTPTRRRTAPARRRRRPPRSARSGRSTARRRGGPPSTPRRPRRPAWPGCLRGSEGRGTSVRSAPGGVPARRRRSRTFKQRAAPEDDVRALGGDAPAAAGGGGVVAAGEGPPEVGRARGQRAQGAPPERPGAAVAFEQDRRRGRGDQGRAREVHGPPGNPGAVACEGGRTSDKRRSEQVTKAVERGPHVPEKARLPEACSLDPCTRATAPPDPMQKLSLKVRLLSSEKATVPPATNKAPPALAFTVEVAELFTKEAVPDITMAHPLPAKIAPPVT